MRVLHVVATGQRRGAEMFASDLTRALARLGGFDQEVVILRGPWPATVAYAAHVNQLRPNGRRLPGLRMGVDTLADVRHAVGRFRPDVLHAHGGEAFKYAVLATATRRVPIVYRRIGSAPDSIRRGMRRVLHSALLRRSDRVVAVADSVRTETIETFGLPGARVTTIPRGIDPDRLRAERGRDDVRDELGIDASALVIVVVGALSPEKDPLAHLDLCAALLRTWPDLAYLFVGDGPMREELRHAVESGGLQGHVQILGTRTDVGDLLGASDLLVLASLTEGMPGCVIEAGMAGLAVVAFGVAGVPEVLVDGVTGYVVRPGDQGCLLERVSQLLADADRRREMGRAAKERCRETYDITAVARRYVDVYAEVAAR